MSAVFARMLMAVFARFELVGMGRRNSQQQEGMLRLIICVFARMLMAAFARFEFVRAGLRNSQQRLQQWFLCGTPGAPVWNSRSSCVEF